MNATSIYSLPAKVQELVSLGWFAVIRRKYPDLPSAGFKVVAVFDTKDRAEDYVNGIYANQADSVNAPLFEVVPETHAHAAR